jgi:hypothetical protein
MVDFDTSTPQLKAVKRLIDAYISLNLNDLEPLLSKDYRYEALPTIPGLPIQTKEDHLKMRREVYSLMKNLDVRIQRLPRAAFAS